MSSEKAIWIVERQPERRAALVRLVNSRLPLVSGAPGDPLFDSDTVAEPRAIVLGLDGDFEVELDFAHRTAERFRGRRWVLVCDADDASDVRRLFDTLRPQLLPWPPEPRELGVLLSDTPRRDSVVPLSARRRRETVGERFSRWFGGDDYGELLRVLDPRMRALATLLRGETGTGRALVARYLHAFGPDPHNAFLAVDCTVCPTPADFSAALYLPGDTPGDATVFLSDVDRLPGTLQATLSDWIAFGPPHATGLDRVRWIASSGPASGRVQDFEPRLERLLLSGLVVPFTPLRERPEAIERFIEATLAAWAEQLEQRGPLLREDARAVLLTHPWPGNLAELESVLFRSLASSSGSELGSGDLRFENDSPEPGTPREPLPNEAPQTARRSPPAAPNAELPPETPRESPNWNSVLAAAQHAIQAPLQSIRTFTELLQEHHDDADFRQRFNELVGGDVERIQEVIGSLSHLSDLQGLLIENIDLAELLQRLVTSCTEVMATRQVLFSTEIDREAGRALADPRLLETALAGLLRRTLEWLPDGGELFLASHHHPASAGRGPRARVLLRLKAPATEPGRDPAKDLERVEGSFEFVAARTAVEALGGGFTLSSSGEREILVLIDLPAPAGA